MRWRKLGRVFRPDPAVPWMASHAALPVAEPIGAHEVRIYFSSRDAAQRSHTGWVEVDLRRPAAPLRRAAEPVLSPGPAGFFDDSGAMLSWIESVGDEAYLYYIGWNLGQVAPFRNALGLAVRDRGGVRRHSPGPILDRGPHDPCFVASACVRREAGGWRMWYLSCLEWQRHGDSLRHRYHLKHATSCDGIDWQRDGTVCIDFRDESEYAISRPCVLHDGDRYRMWYSHRGEAYRIGYAVSRDGLRWERRDDEVGIDVSVSGWDSDMIEYPYVFDHGGARYLLYNGNDYGRDGFGLAVLEQD